MGTPTNARKRAPTGSAFNPTYAAGCGGISTRRTRAHCSRTTEIIRLDLHRARQHLKRQWLARAPGHRRGPSQEEVIAAAPPLCQQSRGATPYRARARDTSLPRSAQWAKKGFSDRKSFLETKHSRAPPSKEKSQRKRTAKSGNRLCSQTANCTRIGKARRRRHLRATSSAAKRHRLRDGDGTGECHV